jgi:hypothetical protein
VKRKGAEARATHLEGVHAREREVLHVVLHRLIPLLVVGPLLAAAHAGRVRPVHLECALVAVAAVHARDEGAAVREPERELAADSEPERVHALILALCPLLARRVRELCHHRVHLTRRLRVREGELRRAVSTHAMCVASKPRRLT